MEKSIEELMADLRTAQLGVKKAADREAHADRLVRLHVATHEGAHFGNWECDDSPTKVCVYNDLRDPMHDSCIFCDGPEERK